MGKNWCGIKQSIGLKTAGPVIGAGGFLFRFSIV